MEKNNLPEKNPYADKNNNPIKGKEILFFQWAEKEHNQHLKTLGPEERKKAEEAISHMAKKMNS